MLHYIIIIINTSLLLRPRKQCLCFRLPSVVRRKNCYFVWTPHVKSVARKVKPM